jgi:DNA modification methylase
MIQSERYTLHHGDCLDILLTLKQGSINLVLVDPPYGIDYQSARRTDRKKWKPKIKNDKTPFLGWAKLLHSLNVPSVICFYRWDVQEPFVTELTQAGYLVKSQIVWDKVVHGMGDLQGEFSPQHELALFARLPHYKFPNKRPSTVLTYQRVDPEKLLHPNEKPVELLEDLITSLTNDGDTVLDFTFGSCATGVACMKTGRKFIGIEKDRAHFAI